MKICPQCQTEYDDTKKFCRHDGSVLKAKTARTSSAERNGHICSRCGISVEVGKRFCRHCGTQLGVSGPVAGAEPRAESPAEAQSNLNVHDQDFLFARGHYEKEAYKEAISYYARLLRKALGNCVYQLHWLLPQIKTFVTKLLATAKEKGRDVAQQAKDLALTFTRYRQATTHNPTNQGYAQKLDPVAALRIQERKQKRRETVRKTTVGIGAGVAVIVFLFGGVWGYRKAQEWFASRAPQRATPLIVAAQPLASPPSVSPAPQTSSGESDQITKQIAPPQEPPRRGIVITAKELEIRVFGRGKGEINRSPEVIQQTIEAHFSELQTVYEVERALDPSVMGSMLLNLTITPGGEVSSVRVQSAKITNKRLQDSVLDRVRGWRFSPAAEEVTVSYPVLFLPPGMDAASIIVWEKSTAALGTERQQTPVERTEEMHTAPPQKRRVLAKETREPRKETVRLGVYRVTTATVLKSEPRSDSSTVAYLDAGLRVRVVGMVGDYLEVHSRKGRVPGYVLRDRTAFVSRE